MLVGQLTPLTAVMSWYGLKPPSCRIWTGPAPFRSNPPMFFRAISALQMTEVLRFFASSSDSGDPAQEHDCFEDRQQSGQERSGCTVRAHVGVPPKCPCG